jgi:hypothetical protein
MLAIQNFYEPLSFVFSLMHLLNNKMLFLFFMKKGLILNVSCSKTCEHKFIKQTLFKQVDVKAKNDSSQLGPSRKNCFNARSIGCLQINISF